MLNRCFLRLFLILAMVGITTPSLAAEDSSKAAKTRLIDKVVAVVEGDVITLRALEALAQPSRRLTAIKMRKNEKHGATILLQALDSVLSEKMIEMEIDANPDLLRSMRHRAGHW